MVQGEATSLPRVRKGLWQFVGWAKAPDANASGGVPTIRLCDRDQDGGHGARAPLPTQRLSECTLKAVAFISSIGMIVSVKRAQKGPLRDVLARNMRKLRAVHGLSQEALAHESCVDRTYVSSIERAQRSAAQRVDRYCRPDCQGARGRAVDAAEGWVSCSCWEEIARSMRG
jgi:DNA-binding XRE family transcriptional regulator